MSEINNDFWKKIQNKNESFPDFFNRLVGGKGFFSKTHTGRPLNYNAPSEANSRLSEIFTNDRIKAMVGTNDITILQFVAMVTIMINETGATFDSSTTENGDLVYMYNYNRRKGDNDMGNIQASLLFKDADFLKAHKRQQDIHMVKNINDPRWAKRNVIGADGKPIKNNYPFDTEPIGGYLPKQNYAAGGIIAECDFYKFRGRGLIQLTGRKNYRDFMKYLIDNKNRFSGYVRTVIDDWDSKNIDKELTKISNKQLDILYTDIDVSTSTFASHGSHAILKKMYSVDSVAEYLGLVYDYGFAISYSKPYAIFYTNRVVQILTAIDGWKKT